MRCCTTIDSQGKPKRSRASPFQRALLLTHLHWLLSEVVSLKLSAENVGMPVGATPNHAELVDI